MVRSQPLHPGAQHAKKILSKQRLDRTTVTRALSTPSTNAQLLSLAQSVTAAKGKSLLRNDVRALADRQFVCFLPGMVEQMPLSMPTVLLLPQLHVKAALGICGVCTKMRSQAKSVRHALLEKRRICALWATPICCVMTLTTASAPLALVQRVVLLAQLDTTKRDSARRIAPNAPKANIWLLVLMQPLHRHASLA
jgi:hypothetical protein